VFKLLFSCLFLFILFLVTTFSNHGYGHSTVATVLSGYVTNNIISANCVPKVMVYYSFNLLTTYVYGQNWSHVFSKYNAHGCFQFTFNHCYVKHLFQRCVTWIDISVHYYKKQTLKCFQKFVSNRCFENKYF
jgi:hypothetical protein